MSRLGWAASIDLLVGRWRVGVRPDTDATRRTLVALLEPYLDASGEPTRTNFSVREERRWWQRAGRASLYVAGDLVVDGGNFDTVARRLAGHLAGVAAEPAPALTTIPARLAVRGNRAVLIATTCTGQIDIPDAGISEATVWHPVIDAHAGDVVTPSPLADLDWRAAKLDPGAPLPERLELVGVVAPPDIDGGANLASVWFSSEGDLDGWALRLGQLDQEGRVEATPVPGDVPAAVRRLLS